MLFSKMSKCPYCSAEMKVSPEDTFVICEYCGREMEVPRFTQEEKRLTQAVEEMRLSTEAAEAALQEATRRAEESDAQMEVRIEALAQQQAEQSVQARMHRDELLTELRSSAQREREEARAHLHELKSEQVRLSGQLSDLRTQQQAGKAASLQHCYELGENAQRAGRFDEAIDHFQELLVMSEDHEAEVHWRIVMCRYGVEYVREQSSETWLPTITHMIVDSVVDDADYRAAEKYARSERMRSYYRDEAQRINDILDKYREVYGQERPYDVFISVKQGDEKGRPTEDSMVAMDLYYMLTGMGLHVFNSRISLQEHAGLEYEPYIMAALMTSKAMLVVGTRSEYMNSPWVRNEWRRYRWLQENGKENRRLIAYIVGMKTNEIPKEMGALQIINAQTSGDPKGNLRRIVEKDFGNRSARKNDGLDDQKKRLRRAELFLEEGSIDKCEEYLEMVLEENPESGMAYALKLCIAKGVNRIDKLGRLTAPIDDDLNFRRAVSFGDAKLKQKMAELNESVQANIRAEAERKAAEERARREREAAEKAKQERLAAEKAQREREEAERKERQRQEFRERMEREAAEKAALAEAEARAQEEQRKRELEEIKRKEAEAEARRAQERLERLQREREEAERRDREAAEKEALAEAEARAQEEQRKRELEEIKRKEAEEEARRAQERLERLQRERAEAEAADLRFEEERARREEERRQEVVRKAREAAEKKEQQERIARRFAEQDKREREARERAEKERQEREAREKAEQERLNQDILKQVNDAKKKKRKKRMLLVAAAVVVLLAVFNKQVTNGAIYVFGDGDAVFWRAVEVIGDDDKMKWFQTAAHKGSVWALYQIGWAYRHALYGEEVDLEKAAEYYIKAAVKGHQESCEELADMLPELKAEAEERQYGLLAFRIAVIYENGLGVQQNIDAAYSWYGNSSSWGYMPGTLKYNEMQAQMEERAAQASAAAYDPANVLDDVQSGAYVERADLLAASGYEAELYSYGAQIRSLAPELSPVYAEVAYSAAAHVFGLAMDMEISGAQEMYCTTIYDLGMLYLDHDEIRNYRAAADCFNTAAEYFHAGSIYMLGHMYEGGEIGAEDFELAFRCYAQAARIGYEPAIVACEERGIDYTEILDYGDVFGNQAAY